MARNGQLYALALKLGHYGLIHGPIPPSQVTERRSPPAISNRSQVGVKTFVLELLAWLRVRSTSGNALEDHAATLCVEDPANPEVEPSETEVAASTRGEAAADSGCPPSCLGPFGDCHDSACSIRVRNRSTSSYALRACIARSSSVGAS